MLLFINVNFGVFMSQLGNLDLLYFGLAVLSYLGLNFCLAFRIQLMLRRLGHSMPFIRVLLFHFTSMILGDVTPGRAGYFGMILLLRDKVKAQDTFSILTIGQIIDFLLKIIGTIAFAALVSTTVLDMNANVVFIAVLLVAAVAAGSALLLFSRRFLRLMCIASGFRTVKNLYRFLLGVQDSTAVLRPVLSWAFLVSVGGWVLVAAQWYFMARAVDIEFSFLYFLLMQAIASTVSFIPVSLGGAGFQEFAIAALLKNASSLPVTYVQALVFGILIRTSSLLTDCLFGVANLHRLSLLDALNARERKGA
ncbi:MAG TPA: flippase-like domain-containing protein [Candidatus Methanoperedenaceae archaeon]|nr:flippase-like domain-containing protein [Candidatus Methanoperedenaceae archaeon]